LGKVRTKSDRHRHKHIKFEISFVHRKPASGSDGAEPILSHGSDAGKVVGLGNHPGQSHSALRLNPFEGSRCRCLISQPSSRWLSCSPILGRSGKVLYSAAATLRPGAVYLLGLNPGGDPNKEPETVRESLEGLATREKNSYLDEKWARQKRAGEAPLQRRVKWLTEQLDLNLGEVCASNLIFVRSKNARDSEYPTLAKRCWPIHREILKMVQPRLIMAYGNSGVSPYAYLRRHFGEPAEQRFPTRHGSWSCRVFEAEGMRMVGLPHLSRYAIVGDLEVSRWVRGFLMR
jgi:hypothetical protein